MTMSVGAVVAVLLVLLPMPLAIPLPSQPQQPERAQVQTTTDGFVFVDDAGQRVGRGRLRTYRLEVERQTGVDPRAFTAAAEAILNDQRGWTGAGRWSLRRVRRDADIRIVLATPRTVDRLCARAGLRTVGRLSCWNGRFAALNVNRWRRGSEGFAGSLRVYRRYLLNHEVGHALGYRHRACPRRAAAAPVMQQQTFATRPCRANGWPTLDP